MVFTSYLIFIGAPLRQWKHSVFSVPIAHGCAKRLSENRRPTVESYLVAKDKISPVVEMTLACHSDQREESCIIILGDNYLEKRRQQGKVFKNLPVKITWSLYLCRLRQESFSTFKKGELRKESMWAAVLDYFHLKCLALSKETNCYWL